MKIPEKAPSIKQHMKNIEKILELRNSNEFINIIKKANNEYLYWDKFKYLILPDEIAHQDAWIYLKMLRNVQINKIPLKDKKENHFGYWQPDGILKKLHFIDQNAGGNIFADTPTVHSAEKEKYLISSIMEEAIASSQLEGAATTRKKAKEMLLQGRKPKNTAERMILNNYITIKNIKKLINEPLSIKLILEIQTSIATNTLRDPTAVGRFRKSDEEISVVDRMDGKILFEPPDADKIEALLENLCIYANKSEQDEFTHPVIKAIILHFWLAYIHPFVDGNGRTARAIFYWFMLKNRYWLFEYLSISSIMLKAPSQYAKSFLYSEIDDQDITYFLNFNLKVVTISIKNLRTYLMRKQKEVQESQLLIRTYPNLNHRQYDILYHAASHPNAIFTIKLHKNFHNIVYQTARTDLIELVEKGFLERKKMGKEFVFIPINNINEKLRQSNNSI